MSPKFEAQEGVYVNHVLIMCLVTSSVCQDGFLDVVYFTASRRSRSFVSINKVGQEELDNNQISDECYYWDPLTSGIDN